MRIKAVILAAGDSSRIGSPKALLTYKGKTFLETIVSSLRQAGINDICVVLGKHADQIIKQSETLGINFIINNSPQDGMISSLRCALNKISADADAVMLSLGDQPLIKAEIYQELLETYKTHQGQIIIAKYDNKKRGHPIVLPSGVFGLCMEGPLDLGLHWVTHHKDVKVFDMHTCDRAVITDVDTLEDYKKLEEF